MNKKKTKGLGNWKHRSQWPSLPWLESPSTLSLLCIKFSPSIEETADRVWKDAFGHLHGILRKSASLRFTLYQRVNFIKTKALFRTVYIAQILQCNSQMADLVTGHELHLDGESRKTTKVGGISTCQSGGFRNDTFWSILSFLVSLPHIQSFNWFRKPRMFSS
jgi:hypothetical protein